MKKIIQAIKNALRWLWDEIKDAAENIYRWALAVRQDRWLALALGMVLTALPALHGWVEWPPIFAAVIGIIHAFVRNWKGKALDWKNYAALAIGAGIIWILNIL